MAVRRTCLISISRRVLSFACGIMSRTAAKLSIMSQVDTIINVTHGCDKMSRSSCCVRRVKKSHRYCRVLTVKQNTLFVRKRFGSILSLSMHLITSQALKDHGITTTPPSLWYHIRIRYSLLFTTVCHGVGRLSVVQAPRQRNQLN